MRVIVSTLCHTRDSEDQSHSCVQHLMSQEHWRKLSDSSSCVTPAVVSKVFFLLGSLQANYIWSTCLQRESEPEFWPSVLPISATSTSEGFSCKEASQDLLLILTLEMINQSEINISSSDQVSTNERPVLSNLECEGLFVLARRSVCVWPKENINSRDLNKKQRM